MYIGANLQNITVHPNTKYMEIGIEMNWRFILPSTQEGAALVVPATCPGKQEHLTVCDRSSILFLLQQRWAAITSHVPAFTCTATKHTHTHTYFIRTFVSERHCSQRLIYTGTPAVSHFTTVCYRMLILSCSYAMYSFVLSKMYN